MISAVCGRTWKKAGIPMMEADVTMIPQTWTELTDEDAIKKMNRILDLLDDDDDVQGGLSQLGRVKTRYNGAIAK